MPQRPNQSPPPQRKTNRPWPHHSTCSALSCQAMGRPQRVTAAGPDKVPLLRAPVAPIQVASRTWRRCPREQESSEAQEGSGAGRRDCSGVRPAAAVPPPPLSGLRSPPSCPGWGCGVSGPGSWPCLGAKGSDLVSQQSLLVTATQLKAKAGRQPGQGGSAAGRRWQERAPGEGGLRQGPAAGLTGVPTPVKRG